MRYTAKSFEVTPSWRVTGAVLTAERLSIDWEEGSQTGHLEAATEDGVSFRGRFGYSRLDDYRGVEFRLYRAKDGEALLLGRWWNNQNGNTGQWVFVLTPESIAG